MVVTHVLVKVGVNAVSRELLAEPLGVSVGDLTQK
jgi:hypothetical protein